MNPARSTAHRLPILESPAFQRLRAQHLPRWLDLVVVGGGDRLEEELPAQLNEW
jgi:hypothetical protein